MTQNDSSNNNKTRWKPTPEDINNILSEHKTWMESDGQEGNQAEIYNADLSDADLSGADLRGARIWDTYLYNADLREADLSQTEGIKPEHLAGADLSGAILPDNLQHFKALDEVQKHSKKSRKIFIITLLMLHFCWVMLMKLTDANLLSRIHLLPKLMPEFTMPIDWFFTFPPAIIFGLYIAIHLNLQRNWEKIAELPTFFPDKLSVVKKIYGWHTNKLILPHLKLLNTDLTFLRRFFNFLTIFSIRWAVPQTLIWFWLRYLTKHDWSLTIYHAALVSLSILFALFFQFLTRRTLRGKDLKGANIFLRFGYLAGIFSVVFMFSFAVFHSVPKGYQSNSISISPKLDGLFGYNLFLDFSDGEISRKPDNWNENIENNKPNDISAVVGADLKDLNVPYSTGRHTFLVKADLSYANLKYSILDSADLRGVNLTGAKLTASSLIGTDLEGANLTNVYFEDVNLLGANLNNVTGLTIHALRKTENWLYAQYGGAILDSLNLPVDHNEKVKNNDLSGYDLSGVNFRGATLAEFNFSGANLQSADLTDVDLTGANLFSTDLRGVIGLEKENLQTALNWFFAIYDEELMTDFDLPANHIELTNKKDFRTYNFEDVNLSGADFKGANLRQVNMKNAILHNVNLRDADLYAVDLSGADLTGANFKSTILLDTDIRGAILTGVKNLTMEQLRWAIFDSATIFPDSLKDPAGERLRNK